MRFLFCYAGAGGPLQRYRKVHRGLFAPKHAHFGTRLATARLATTRAFMYDADK